MRMTENEISRIVKKIFSTWKENNLIEYEGTDHSITAFMEALFTKNLKEEDDLNKEVDQLLKKYESQITGAMDQRKMFQMIKNQLIKDRKMVI